MKLFRWISVFLSAVIICTLSACGGGSSVPASGGTSDSENTTTVDVSFADESATIASQTISSQTMNSAASMHQTVQSATASATSSKPVTKKENTTASITAAPSAIHKHVFAGAACTKAGKCSCGAVGTALGHDFSPKSCTAPAVCKRCGATNGSALGHNYAGGKCKRCGDTNGPLKPSEAVLFRNKLTDEQNAQALAVAREIVKQINAQLPDGSDLDRIGMAASLVSQEYRKGVHVEKGNYYNTAYGVFVKRESSCAGCCRALGLVLSCMGYQWTHVNENQWTHQWVSLIINGESVWADGQVGWVGTGKHPAA